MQTLIGILVGLLLLGFIMFLHELGHYWAGRALGFKILEFNIFMGPILFKWERNGVQYALRLIPLGASVAFAGEDGGESESDEAVATKNPTPKITNEWGRYNAPELSGGNDPRLFDNRAIWKRAVTLFAGPFMNFLSAFVALVILVSFVGFQRNQIAQVNSEAALARAGLQPGDRLLSIDGEAIRSQLDYLYLAERKASAELNLRYERAGEVHDLKVERRRLPKYRLGIVMDNSGDKMKVKDFSAEASEARTLLQKGDVLLEVAGQPFKIEVLATELEMSQGKAISLSIERNGEKQAVEVKPFVQEQLEPLGIELAREHGFFGSVCYAFDYSKSVLRFTFKTLGQLFTGGAKASETLSGPVGIVGTISSVAVAQVPMSERLMVLTNFFVLISLSLGIMNLLPIPLLDGSRLILLVIEKIRGKRLSEKAMKVFVVVGLVLIGALFALGLFYDLLRLFK